MTFNLFLIIGKNIIICFFAVSLFFILNVIVSSFILRNYKLFVFWIKKYFENQLNSLTSQLISVDLYKIHSILFAQTFLYFLLFYCALFSDMTALSASALIICYVFFNSLFLVSFLHEFRIFKDLGNGTFIKLSIIFIPLFITYLAKGYSFYWIGEIFGINASNVIMAQFAAMCMLLMAGLAAIFSILSIVYELAFLLLISHEPKKIKLCSTKLQKNRTLTGKVFLLFSTKEKFIAENSRTLSVGNFSILLLLLSFFLNCLIIFNIGFKPVIGNFGGIVLSSVIFEFDAAPAKYCKLNDDEKKLAEGKNPKIKALFFSSTQDKAYLIRRSDDFFDDFKFKDIDSDKRKLEILRIADCNNVSEINS